LYVERLQGLAKKHGAGLLNIFDDWQVRRVGGEAPAGRVAAKQASAAS
jgi:hypothetical protein